jgi:hypothetical protein
MAQVPGFPRFRPLSLAVLALLAAPVIGRAEERHYLLIFAAQSTPKIPRLTHTFATIVRVTDGPPGCPPWIEAYTISWLPQTLKVRPYRLNDEPGRNLTLQETLCWAYSNHMHVALWGPYAIEPDFFARIYQEYAKIMSGVYRYKAIDPNQRGARTTDCIHALTDIDRVDGRSRFPEWRSGEAVTRMFVRVLRDRGRLFLPSGDTCWLEAALGLNRYPILHRPNP